MSDLSDRLRRDCTRAGCEPCSECLRRELDAADELDRLQADRDTFKTMADLYLAERQEIRGMFPAALDEFGPQLTDAIRQLLDSLHDELANDAEINPCGHAQHWTAYRDPTDRRSETYCVFCEMERLQKELAAEKARQP